MDTEPKDPVDPNTPENIPPIENDGVENIENTEEEKKKTKRESKKSVSKKLGALKDKIAGAFERKEKTEDERDAEINAKFIKSFPTLFAFKEKGKDKKGKEIPIFDMSSLDDLSVVQKTILLNKIETYSAREAKLRARDILEIDKKHAKNGKGFWGKIGNIRKGMALSFSKNAKLLKYEKESMSDIKSEIDIETFRPTVENRNALVYENGRIKYQYASDARMYPAIDTIREDERDEFEQNRNIFENIANQMANIPEDWSMPEASKELRVKYESAKESFEYAKSCHIHELTKAGATVEQAGMAIAQMEQLVNTDRLFASDPRTHKAFSQIEKGSVFKKYFTGYFQDNSKYMIGGGATRKGVAVAALGSGFGMATLIAAPIVSGAIGFLRGKKRAQDDINYENKNRRRYVTNAQDREYLVENDLGNEVRISRNNLMYKMKEENTANYLKSLETQLNEEEDIDKKNIIADRMQEAHNKLERGETVRIGGIEKMQYTIERIIGKIDNDWPSEAHLDSQERTAFWRTQLENRLDYIKDKIEKGEIKFAVGQDGISEKIMLNNILSRGAIELAKTDTRIQFLIRAEINQLINEETEVSNISASTKNLSGITDRFNQRVGRLTYDQVGYRKLLKNQENIYIKRKAWESATTGALFGLAGAEVAEYLWGHHPSNDGTKVETSDEAAPSTKNSLPENEFKNPDENLIDKNPNASQEELIEHKIPENKIVNPINKGGKITTPIEKPENTPNYNKDYVDGSNSNNNILFKSTENHTDATNMAQALDNVITVPKEFDQTIDHIFTKKFLGLTTVRGKESSGWLESSGEDIVKFLNEKHRGKTEELAKIIKDLVSKSKIQPEAGYTVEQYMIVAMVNKK